MSESEIILFKIAIYSVMIVILAIVVVDLIKMTVKYQSA